MKIPFKITIPYARTNNVSFIRSTDIGLDVEFDPEPFHTRESLISTLHHKVLAALTRAATVEIDEKTLDKALAACNSIVADLEREVLEEPQDMLQITTFDEYENERLNTGNDDEDERWLERHYTLSGVIGDVNDEYDTEALIKSALAKDYE